MPICHQLFSTLEVSNTVYHSSDCLLHDLVDLNGGKRVPKASAGWAALGIMSLLLGNIIYVLLFDLWTVPGQEAPSPQSVFALVMSECPGLVHGGSLHWEMQAPGYRTGESQVDQCQSSACSQQVRITPKVSHCQCRLHSAWHPQEGSGGAFCAVLVTPPQRPALTAAAAPEPALQEPPQWRWTQNVKKAARRLESKRGECFS